MVSLKHILFPTDFSERCYATAPFVEAMARRFGAKITLMSAAQPYWFVGEPAAPTPSEEPVSKADVEARLERAFAKQFAGLQVERVAELGEPAEMITKFAHSGNVDLIMMPTHGYGRFRTLLLGSVTAKVLHDAECPVWTGVHLEEPPAAAHLAGKNVLCAVDGTPKTAIVIDWASGYAKSTGAALRLVHVLSNVEATASHKADRDFQELQHKGAIERLEKFVDVDAPVQVVTGTVARAVREEAERCSADLVVIGRGLVHESLGRLREHSYAIIREAPCPVVSV
jgi:nucleotide-binding universal stress UspA family protein